MPAVDRACTIDDLRRMALRRLPRFIGDYVETGAGEGDGVRRNVEGYRRLRFVSRGLVKVDQVDLSNKVFGRTFALPFGISAVGMAGIYRKDTDKLLARVAREANIPFLYSSAGSSTIEEVARVAPDHTWFQLYASKRTDVTGDLIDRARDSGVSTLVLTVDYPVPLVSQVAARTGISMTKGLTLKTFPRLAADTLRHPRWTLHFLRHGGMPMMEGWRRYLPPGSRVKDVAQFYIDNWCHNLDWSELEALRRRWPRRFVVKGLVHADDVRRAFDLGVDGVTVSNHGGNKLDVMEASIDALRSMREAGALAPNTFVDGGIRRGADVAFALASGAQHCFIGRATIYGVTVGGYEGALRAVDILRSELAYTMAMIGCAKVDDVRRAEVVAGSGR